MGKITILGLGPGEYSLISQGVLDKLKSSSNIYFRTEKHPVVEILREEIEFSSLDYFYDDEEDFESVYQNISNYIINLAKDKDIVYAVPGHPRVAENTVSIICDLSEKEGIEIETIPSMSFVDAMFDYLEVDPANGFKLLDAFEIENSYIDTNTSMIITQVYDEFIASNIKLKLMEYYDYDHKVCIVNGAGVKNLESKVYVPLYELDRKENRFDYLTSLYIPKSINKKYTEVYDLEKIIETLRDENGCEWDKKQTHKSLNKNIIEEAYELCSAIDNDDIDEMIEELGDILLQVVFHSQIGKESGYFDLKEVVNGICNKLINRHPHVFENVDIDMDKFEEVWEDIKKKEKNEEYIYESLERIPKQLPALIKSSKIQKKAGLVGFDWDNINDITKKIEEEYKELLDECQVGNIKYIEEELGDLLFSVVNLARFLKVDPEEALNLTNKKFVNRFKFMEEKASSMGVDFKSLPLNKMDELWEMAKKNNIK